MFQHYCDLNTFLRKPLIFKGLNQYKVKNGEVEEIPGKEFIVPGQLPVKFVMKLTEYVKKQDAISKGEIKATDEEVINDMKNMVLEIINLDKQHKYTIKDVEENFDDMFIMQTMIKKIIDFVYLVESDPNSKSPESK